MTASTVLQAPWQLLVSAGVVLLLTCALAWRKIRRATKGTPGDEIFAQVVMIVALAWSADIMWIIARDKLKLDLGLTILLFTVFEAALLLSMRRAKLHMQEFNWPGRFGVTAWTIALLMSVVAATASSSLAEAVIRMAIPIMVTKLWWDGLIGGAVRRTESTTSWRWTPRRLLLAIGAIEPGERDVRTVHRERLIQTMTRLEYLRQNGAGWRASQRASRLARLSLTADDAIITEVRQRVSRATWYMDDPVTHQLTHPLTHQLTHPGDASVTRQAAASPTQSERVNRPLTSGDAADAGRGDAATQAAQLLIDNRRRGVKMSIREAARRFPDAKEPTVRRRIKELDDALATQPVTQPVTRVNGHKPELEMTHS